ncbi:flagellar hook assembly protein FlgD [Ciceribacter sp. L1K22]|uniref:flagellar hook assembly protein FlgD n=1 Tax=Ciceribacter sp. L1K22 TaxID=2820275 RepID=UPI001ABDF502|nr:flagellar hook assembly protein FlgD [Ciceribacter sp. L1K22]MBO3758347.1 flagellar hook assembly protein FlgD [Ciceribacter sp. L1K22]
MAVDGVTAYSSVANSTASSSASSAASLNYDSFLQLLIAQMKNQDPTDPMDASEQVAQLATFSQVEQTIQTNQHLESLIAGSALTNAADFIGKTITNADGSQSGIIESVKVFSDAIVAYTSDGEEIPLTVGVTVGKPLPTETDDTDSSTDT